MSVFREEHPHTLAMYCSDGRFAKAIEELVLAHGEAHTPDEMCLPGGPGLLDPWTAESLMMSHQVEGLFDFLVVGHKIKTVLLVAHEGCGYYKKRYAHLDGAGQYKRQEMDLLAAAVQARTRHPSVVVKTFYASVERGQIVFEEVLP